MKDLEIIIDPYPKPRMTRADSWKRRPCVVRYWAYKDNLKKLSKELNYRPGETLSLTFIIAMPKSWSNKKKEALNGKAHKQKPDLDNLIKAFKDCLMVEDSHVHTYPFMRKIWGFTGKILVHRSEDEVEGL